MSKPITIDLRNYPGVRFDVDAGNTRNDTPRAKLRFTVDKLSTEQYMEFREIIEHNNSRYESKRRWRTYHIISNLTVAKVYGYMGHSESTNIIGHLFEHTVSFYCTDVELMSGEHAIRKYLIDQALADADSSPD